LSKKTKTPSIRRSREDISKIAAFADWCIWGVTAGIALVFAGITLKDIPFVPALSSTNPDYLQSILLSLYIACWAAGTTIDTKVQNSVYLIDPSGGRVRYGAVIAVVALSLVSLAVLLTRKNELYFSVSVREHLESSESFVIQGWRSDLKGRRCGRRRTAVVTTEAGYAIRAI
jgi:hypothetical protein